MAKAKVTEKLSQNLFPVVGVGASAGGLNAFKELIKAIPQNPGMAYILIQHLAPEHESLLPEILQKITTIPVVEITNNIKVLPNHIYIIPENRLLTANDGVLELHALIKGERLNTIDVFFTSLAEVHQSYAIGILLSGTGSDGTVGLKTIKDVGGYSIAQDESAEYNAMPQGAIDAGVVDFVIPPKKMPDVIKELVHNAQIAPSNISVPEEVMEDEIFKQIITLIRSKRGTDFTYYKQSTIRRRILRRKALNRIESLKNYQIYLLENKAEQDALYKDILIPVTAFFRDPEIFDLLSNTAFSQLFKEKPVTEPVRVWIAGCSTGEEAYSMAICLHEYFSDKPAPAAIQIFATDISEYSIAKARSGIYLKRDMAGVSESRMKQFFTKIDGSYQVNKILREMVVFATQNFLKDPPFAKLDFISCRNVLIYMEPYLQKKAFTTFNYALNKKGILLLGKSESIMQPSQEFNLLNKKDKLYIKKHSVGKSITVTTEVNETSLKKNNAFIKVAEKKDDFQKAAEEALLLKYASVGVIVNDQLDILQFRGLTGTYLEAPPGKASHNILRMAKEGLSFELRNALHKAKSANETIRKENIPLDKGKRKVSIEIIPLHNTIELYFLVLFEETIEPSGLKIRTKKNKAARKVDVGPSNSVFRNEQLEKELAQAREDMRSITEEQEAANEELQSANEELLSGSEELQTLNEELETSKEEIQSSNEELNILNQELIERNEQLIHARKYAEAIVTTIHEPLIIITKEFRIKSANKSFYETFELTEQQTEGKLFFEWKEGIWNLPELKERLQNILPNHTYFEDFELTITDGSYKKCLLLNGRQIINNTNEEQLILLAMEDISVRKELENKQKAFAEELESRVVQRTQELKEANTNLLYSNNNLQQLASIAAHDLQEPLRKIRTFSSILNKSYSDNINDEGKEVVGKISIAAGRMSQLIKEVLEYTKVMQVNKEFEQANLDIILKKIINDYELLITETKAQIIYEEPLPIVDAVPLQMNQLFFNLLGNALKFYQPSIPPVIKISYKTLIDDDVNKLANLTTGISYIEIKISDNGIGFEQEYAEQIFQIFERLHTTDEFEGTGIGLALCKKIVENHMGHIYAVSINKEGAAFFVVLPLKH